MTSLSSLASPFNADVMRRSTRYVIDGIDTMEKKGRVLLASITEEFKPLFQRVSVSSGSHNNVVINFAASGITDLLSNSKLSRLMHSISSISLSPTSEVQEEGEAESKELAKYNHTLEHIKGLKVTILTIGSRGDVQPYLALGKGLQEAGYVVRIASHQVFQEWIESQGFEFRRLAGEPEELMKLW